jgi:hypothetical protein
MHVAENSLIRTTITPWMESTISEKDIKQEDDANSEPDVAVGECMTNIVVFFIIVTCTAMLFQRESE